MLGLPTYLVTSLLQMSKYGGTGSQATKEGLDSIFNVDTGPIPCVEYTNKLISCTADGASVNFGQYSGLLTKMTDDGRPWLVKIHCANHRIELAVKNAFSDSVKFNEVDKLYMAIFNLLKNSGAIKSDVKKAAEVLNISFYALPKLTGTRFVSHHTRAYRHLLDMWPALISAFDNTLVTRQHKGETRAKIMGFLKQLRSYRILCAVCCHLDLLEKITPASLVFECDGLLPGDIAATIQMTCLELEDLAENIDTPEELLDSHLSRFQFNYDDDGNVYLQSTYVKHGDMLKKAANRESMEIKFENFTEVNQQSMSAASREKKKIAEKLVETLQERFAGFKDPIFKHMLWFNPLNWTDEKEYGRDQISSLYEHFEVPFLNTNYDHSKIFPEWKRFRMFVKVNYAEDIVSGKAKAINVWEKVLKNRKNEFPNLCMMAELIIAISASNSSVERSFSTLTNILSDRRLKMSHSTLENLIIIKGNDRNWSQKEREEILSRAVSIYLKKRRYKKVDSPIKRRKITRTETIEIPDDDEGSDEDSSDEDTTDSDTSSDSDDFDA